MLNQTNSSLEDKEIHFSKVDLKQFSDEFRRVDIALDTYDDIFSDFDSSSYSSRLISEDFVHEVLRKFNKREKKRLQIVFSIPAKERNSRHEHVIKKRIKEYFLEKMYELNDKSNIQKKEATTLMFAGFFSLLLVLTVAMPGISIDPFLARVIETFLLPVGWFGLWEGTNRFFDAKRRFDDEKKTYEALASADYIFISEEKIVENLTMTDQVQFKAEPMQVQQKEILQIAQSSEK
ncbi:MAG: hypothetical protein N3E37_03855 [Candidatus Micrarchaeota archaeon]|nr:hypothetical protein [Candidatus Micrarchaeota archaeon]